MGSAPCPCSFEGTAKELNTIMASTAFRDLLMKVIPNDVEVHRAEDGGRGGMTVIGAGLPRTGTLSLRAALKRLLGGNVYHMAEVFDKPEHAEFWLRMLEGLSTQGVYLVLSLHCFYTVVLLLL